MNDEITLGLDAEGFLANHLKFIPSCGLIGGTKENPRPMEGLPSGFAVQEDNVTLEFNIPPVYSKEEWRNNINTALTHIKNKLAVHPQGPLHLHLANHVSFKIDDLLAHPAAMIMGCDPDKNAYTGKRNTSPNAAEMGGIRTAGAHIHVGYPNPTPIMNRKIVVAMDIFLGKKIKKDYDDSVREKFYGKLGAYRDKPYGVEYRALSPVWLKFGHLISFTYEKTIEAYMFAKNLPLQTLINISTYENS